MSIDIINILLHRTSFYSSHRPSSGNTGAIPATQREGSKAYFNCLISFSVATGKGDEAEPAL